MVTIIISVASLLVAGFGVYRTFNHEEDLYISGCENLDMYDELQSKIIELESGINAHVVNIRELEAKVSGLKTEVELLSRSVTNLSTTTNNLIPFVDKTRGMVEENTKRLDQIQGNVPN